MDLSSIKNSKIAGYFRPKEFVNSIHDIDADHLIKAGIKAVIIDLDETIMPRIEYRVPIATYSWIEKMKENGLRIFLVSNGARIPRVTYIADTLQIESRALAFKPLPFAFRTALKALKAEPKETAVIGDQIITDVLGGNIMGMYTILVTPCSEEKSLLRIPMRFVENVLINFLGLKIKT